MAYRRGEDLVRTATHEEGLAHLRVVELESTDPGALGS